MSVLHGRKGAFLHNQDQREEAATAFLSRWMRAVCSGDPAAPLSLYGPRAVLIPTFGADVLQGHRAIGAYFRRFLGERPGLCGAIDPTTVVVQSLPGGAAVVSGIYHFRWPPSNSAAARFSYVLVDPSRSGHWQIANHHSSALP